MKTRMIAVAVLLLTMLSCTKTPEEMLIGNWQGKMGTMEFLQDGSAVVVVTDKASGRVATIKGSWAPVEEGKIKMDLAYMGESMSQVIAINFVDSDKLEITDEKGEVDNMTRIASSGDSGKAKASSSGSVAGIYGGKGCIYDKMELKENGKIYVTAFGMEFPGVYEVDGDRISFTDGEGRGIVFKRKGDALDGGIAGICNRL